MERPPNNYKRDLLIIIGADLATIALAAYLIHKGHK